MLTQCPNCQTIFRVTSEILRVAEGQVRCGRCQRQFDALDRLIEENDDTDSALDDYRRGQSSDDGAGTIEVREPETHEDITLEGRHIEISGTYRVPDRFGNGTEVQQETTEEWVQIDEDSDSEDFLAEQTREADSNDDAAEPDASGDGLTDYERELLEDEAVLAQLEQSKKSRASRTTGSPRFARPAMHLEDSASDSDPIDPDLLSLRAHRAPQPVIWRILAAPLALLLIVQWIHAYRANLARHPTIGEPIQAAYRAFGTGLTPNWDLHAYQIRQWGVISDPATPGTLKVRASITNLADFAQPYPLLKLMLEDRWGEQIRARAFEPAEYLDPSISPDRMLNPGQQTNATIVIVDPGPDAEGFRFDVCLRGRAGTVCGEEVRRR